jgi:hypothetical protein
VGSARHSARLARATALLAALGGLLFGCVEDVDLGQFQAPAASAGSGVSGGSGSGGSGIDIGGAPSSGGAGSGGVGGCTQALCGGKIYQCGDCIDNDADGLTDSDDSQCLGPCDNTEDSFYGGIPGQNNSPCRQDCYFDSDTGPGNDDCYWSHRCDELSVPDTYPPSGDVQCEYDPATNVSGAPASCEGLAAEQSMMCAETCGPLVPNGCDCFGCCELPAGSGDFVWLGSNTDGSGSCSEETLGDPSACRPCTPVPSCFNACDECELCAGRLASDDTCAAPDDNVCGADYQPCGRPGQDPCSPDTYCITGCCITIPR